MDSPLVSIIVCTYNAGEYLWPSVQSIIDQTYRNLEIVIVDDGSTDGSVNGLGEIQDARVRVLRQENAGKSVALNRALGEIRGEFYAIQDADDLSHPSRIEWQLRYMQQHPDVAAVFCGHDILLDDRHLAPRFRAKGPETCRADIEAFRMPAHDPTVMYRVDAVRGIEYEETLRIGQGYDYILRVGEKYPMIVLGECLYSYRVHRDSATKRDPARREQMVREVLRRACERRGRIVHGESIELLVMPPSAVESKDNNLAADFIESALDQRRVGSRWGAIRTGWACVSLNPLKAHYHKAMVYAVAPMWLVRRLRRSQS